MISLPVSQQDLQQARSHYDFYNIKNSLTEGASQIYGAVGEIKAVQWVRTLGETADFEHTKDYDLRINGLTTDVKVARCKSEPSPTYRCSIASSSMHQQPDYYLFMRVIESMVTAWVLGFIPKDQFIKKAKFFRKGEVDPDDQSGLFIFKSDCYSVKASDLYLP